MSIDNGMMSGGLREEISRRGRLFFEFGHRKQLLILFALIHLFLEESRDCDTKFGVVELKAK